MYSCVHFECLNKTSFKCVVYWIVGGVYGLVTVMSEWQCLFKSFFFVSGKYAIGHVNGLRELPCCPV